MAATESDILRDEQERGNLLKAISDVEAAIAAYTPGTRRLLENTVENAKNRLVTLDKRIEEAKVERAAEAQAQATAAAVLTAKETKLSADERAAYRGFLEESYFTKKDFGRLDEFYTHGYDRLSEGGKDQMSKRFWEGVNQGEYQFGDAPSVMQQKEAERAKEHLGLDDLNAKQVGGMPKEEQRAFADAYNSDDRTAAKQVLARNLLGRTNDRPVASKADRSSGKNEPSSALADIDLSAIDLKNVQLADATQVTSTSVPDLSGSRVNAR